MMACSPRLDNAVNTNKKTLINPTPLDPITTLKPNKKTRGPFADGLLYDRASLFVVSPPRSRGHALNAAPQESEARS